MANLYAVPGYFSCGGCGYVTFATYDHPGVVKVECRNHKCEEYEKEVLVEISRPKIIRKGYVDGD